MAKETKDKKATATIAAVNEENFDEQIKNVNTFNEEILAMATEKMDKEEKERRADQLARMSRKATYINLRSVAQSKYTKECMNIMSECRDKTKGLLEDLKAGKITPVEYDDKLDEVIKDATKSIETKGKELRRRKTELEDAFPGYWSYSWNNPFERLNAAMRNNS